MCTGRGTNGTGFAGSDTYSSNAAVLSALPCAFSNARPKPGFRYSGVAAGTSGHWSRRRQRLTPVWYDHTGGVSNAGAPSFRYWLKKGSMTSRRNSRAVSPVNFSAPKVEPS